MTIFWKWTTGRNLLMLFNYQWPSVARVSPTTNLVLTLCTCDGGKSPNQMLPVKQPTPFSVRPWRGCTAGHQGRGKAWWKGHEQCALALGRDVVGFNETEWNIWYNDNSNNNNSCKTGEHLARKAHMLSYMLTNENDNGNNDGDDDDDNNNNDNNNIMIIMIIILW